MMETLSKTDYALTLTGFFTLLSLLEHGYTYSLPHEGKKLNKERAEIFYDNKIIPERVEKNVYIYKTITNRFAFIKKNDNSPLAITVTPCASHITWKVTFREIHSQLDSVTGNTPSAPLIHLQNFTSEAASTYKDDHSQKGLYLIELEPVTRETYARIYVTTTPETDKVFPALPSDNRVDITQKTNKEINIMWKPSPTTLDQTEYCIVFSRKQQFYSHCGVLAHFYGDVKPTLPPHTGFGFKGEKEKKKLLRKSAKPIRAASKGQIFYECVGSKHSYTFKKAKAGRKYFINVFAINKATNMSVSYAGSQVRLKRGKRKRLELKEGRMKTLIFKRKRTQKVQFRLVQDVKVLNLHMQACGGTMKIRISKNKKKIKIARTNVKLLKILTLQDMKSGEYLISISGDKRRNGIDQSMTLLFNDNSSQTDVPKLPENMQITVSEKLIRCDQVTLAWTSIKDKQRYCIYKNEVQGAQVKNITNWNAKPQCTALNTRKKSQKVLCKIAQHTTKHQEELTETIEKLTPGTSYIFSVYVGPKEQEMFTYQSVIVTTKSSC